MFELYLETLSSTERANSSIRTLLRRLTEYVKTDFFFVTSKINTSPFSASVSFLGGFVVLDPVDNAV